MNSDKWYVVRTKPGAQLAFRRYVVKKISDKTGKPIKPVLETHKDPKQSAIEAAMQEAGFECYMPVETKTVIHHRTKKLIERRFPILPGYVFVKNVTDWPSLTSVPGFADILGINGCPITIPELEIDKLRTAEHAINEDNRLKEEAAKRLKQKVTRRVASRITPIGSRVQIDHSRLGKQWGRVSGVTGRKTIKVALDNLNNMKPVEVGISTVLQVDTIDNHRKVA